VGKSGKNLEAGLANHRDFDRADIKNMNEACAMSKSLEGRIRPSLRNPNLDVLRAVAICSVVSFHVLQMSPEPFPGVMRFARYGQFGVDLFFVLSGWLIGTLYWNEVYRFGKINLSRFWVRRWIRTIPPYLVALGLAWTAVFVQRREQFDPGYLLFFQNYYQQIPFFLVSWSLCIEEHFYLFLPLLLFILPRNVLTLSCLFGILLLVSPIGRVVESLFGIGSEFGYAHTATHLRLEGLIIGFGLAFFPIFLPAKFDALTRKASTVAAAAALGFLLSQFLPPLWKYRVEASVLAVGLSAVLVLFVNWRPTRLSSSTVIRGIAVASYSAYLTHALVIHLALLIVRTITTHYWFIYFPIVLTLIVLTAAIFYYTVELPSIRWRDNRFPRRSKSSGAEVVVGSKVGDSSNVTQLAK
jgi:peptidoglycan/LPS O-acetylase OafA/YrhL